MLYLIGGPPRMGKSTLAQKLLHERQIPYVSTDALTVMLEPFGETTYYGSEKSARFFPLLELFIMRMLKSSPDYAIEGDAFSPHHVDDLSQKYELRSVFLKMSEVSTTKIIEHIQFDDWVTHDSPQQLEDLARRIVAASQTIEQECDHFGIPCFDMSKNYDTSFQRAYDALFTPLT